MSQKNQTDSKIKYEELEQLYMEALLQNSFLKKYMQFHENQYYKEKKNRINIENDKNNLFSEYHRKLNVIEDLEEELKVLQLELGEYKIGK